MELPSLLKPEIVVRDGSLFPRFDIRASVSHPQDREPMQSMLRFLSNTVPRPIHTMSSTPTKSLLLSQLLLPPYPLPFPCPETRTPKHDRRPHQHSGRQLVPEQPDAEQQTRQFPHVEHNRDAEGRGPRAEEVDAADAEVLGQGVEGEVEDVLWNRKYGQGREEHRWQRLARIRRVGLGSCQKGLQVGGREMYGGRREELLKLRSK